MATSLSGCCPITSEPGRTAAAAPRTAGPRTPPKGRGQVCADPGMDPTPPTWRTLSARSHDCRPATAVRGEAHQRAEVRFAEPGDLTVRRERGQTSGGGGPAVRTTPTIMMALPPASRSATHPRYTWSATSTVVP
jgi:hypothetical protein